MTVRAYPQGPRDGLKGEIAGELAVATTKPPERGKANEAILKILAQALDVKRASLSLLAGETARRKRVRIVGLSKGELEARLARALNETR
ncbi:MAG: DUF167 family protein [Planctomycetota bacterium]